MSRKFVNSQGTYEEEVGIGTNFAVLFFGPLALAAYGLWRHFIVWILCVVSGSAIHVGFGILAHLVMTFYYTFLSSDYRCESYLESGWREVKSDNRLNEIDAGDIESDFEESEDLDKDNKICPFCAETIKAAAIKCKHCGSDLTDK